MSGRNFSSDIDHSTQHCTELVLELSKGLAARQINKSTAQRDLHHDFLWPGDLSHHDPILITRTSV